MQNLFSVALWAGENIKLLAYHILKFYEIVNGFFFNTMTSTQIPLYKMRYPGMEAFVIQDVGW